MKKRWMPLGAAASIGLGLVASVTASATTPPDDGGGDTPAVDPASIATDIGVDDTTIKVGILGDQSGAFAPLVIEIIEAQQDYWDMVNDNGGIGGRQVELVIEDMRYDVPTMLEKYEGVRDEVAIISQSTGSPHTAAIASMLEEDDLIAIPLSWYSGWPDADYGANVYETYATYCVESMNAIEWLHENRDVQTVALASFPGEFGGDGDAGARLAIEALGMEIVYDGVGQITPPSADNPNPDQSGVISQIVASDADLVWMTSNPTALASIMAGAVGQGFDGLWSGNSPTYSFKLLGTDLAPLLDEYFIASTYIATWGTDVPGMEQVVSEMTARSPELPVSDVYILGWTEAQVTHTILEQAAANGDMTRTGILAAASEVEVDFGGLAPSQSWSGDPNDFIVRESYLYDVTLDEYNITTLGEGGGSTGWELLEGPYVGQVATDYVYEGPCYAPTA